MSRINIHPSGLVTLNRAVTKTVEQSEFEKLEKKLSKLRVESPDLSAIPILLRPDYRKIVDTWYLSQLPGMPSLRYVLFDATKLNQNSVKGLKFSYNIYYVKLYAQREMLYLS